VVRESGEGVVLSSTSRRGIGGETRDAIARNFLS
jgi:hypothetical protein